MITSIIARQVSANNAIILNRSSRLVTSLWRPNNANAHPRAIAGVGVGVGGAVSTLSTVAGSHNLHSINQLHQRPQQHQLQNQQLQWRSFHPSDQDLEGDLDDLCKKHMELPAEDFADGCRFLHQVALGNIEAVKQIVFERGQLVNFRDYDRRTPLHIAASEGHLTICQFLVSEGARVNRSDRWGGSPLDDAHRHRHLDCVQFLETMGGTFGSSSQATNFIAAASEGDMEEVATLLRLGNVDVNGGDYDRRTALHLAAGNGHDRIIEFLCEAGANVNVVDRWGGKPLDDAQLQGHVDCVELLQKYGAKNGKNSENASMGREALIDLFHLHAKMRNGELCLDWHDVSDLLHAVGEDPTDAVVRKLLEALDGNEDGFIDKEEFLEHSDLFLRGRPARIILVVGGPGSGKGLLSERLVKECEVVHLSSGDMLRAEVEAGTPIGRHVDEIMKSGNLVPSSIMVALMQKQMKGHPGKRILLDGFPRSAENAMDLVTLCGRPELALHLDCDDTILIERILARGKSGMRSDDNIHTALQRIRTYHKYHQLTLDFLREEHVPIVNLDCSATPQGVWEQLCGVGRLMRKAVKTTTSTVNIAGSTAEKSEAEENAISA
eukprot:CAMPEP_0183734700 /NCGR_PEP_ID=MMETSP0737-20130205/44567_1 /TAXON_ID=385413 /ORGANISM="Thalassiosira miniscula, Strain CCMP1093" /LENGTH=607 /DNA_ID=CAMNT_0025968265 /DNA_START=54 /DNA_END=1877 /DNA_ORIENTATION=-